MNCLIYSIAESVDFIKIEQLNLLKLEKSHSKDVLYYIDKFELFIFNNGNLVFWGCDASDATQIIEKLRPALVGMVEHMAVEELIYIYDETQDTTITQSENLNHDIIILSDHSVNLKLSISYALSRSTQVKYFDQRLESLIRRYAPLANSIYRQGKIDISRKGILKVIGELMVTKSEINLVNNFSYIPVFFWKNPMLEQYFIMIEKYLDVEIRAATLNQRLNTLNEIFTLLNSYLEYRRSLYLEIAIVVFVGIEVVFNILSFYF